MQSISSYTAAYDTFPFAIPLDDSEIEVISSSGEVADGVAVRDGNNVVLKTKDAVYDRDTRVVWRYKGESNVS